MYKVWEYGGEMKLCTKSNMGDRQTKKKKKQIHTEKQKIVTSALWDIICTVRV